MWTWAEWIEEADRRVADSTVGNVRVSTVFLGIDHSFDPGDPPLLFETLIFGGQHDGEMWRYETWDEAEAGHARAVQLVEFYQLRKPNMGFEEFLSESAKLIDAQRKKRE